MNINQLEQYGMTYENGEVMMRFPKGSIHHLHYAISVDEQGNFPCRKLEEQVIKYLTYRQITLMALQEKSLFTFKFKLILLYGRMITFVVRLQGKHSGQTYYFKLTSRQGPSMLELEKGVRASWEDNKEKSLPEVITRLPGLAYPIFTECGTVLSDRDVICGFKDENTVYYHDYDGIGYQEFRLVPGEGAKMLSNIQPPPWAQEYCSIKGNKHYPDKSPELAAVMAGMEGVETLYVGNLVRLCSRKDPWVKRNSRWRHCLGDHIHLTMEEKAEYYMAKNLLS